MDAELITMLRRGESGAATRARFRALCPGLSIEDSPSAPRLLVATDATELRAPGFSRVAGAGLASSCRALVSAVARLRQAQLPATFVYAFDEIWQLGQAVRQPGYRIAADVWAWQIEPGKGRGWTPHRGIHHERLDRDAPELLNTWVALSDVEVDRACMHFVPLDDDPAYPGRLESIEVPEGKAIAAPLAAGEALVWNANVLHWGGECAATARGPRVSCSFSLVREDAVDLMGLPLADPPPRTLAERLELIARQIVVYGEGQPDVRPEVLEWARASVAMAAAVAKLSRELSGT